MGSCVASWPNYGDVLGPGAASGRALHHHTGWLAVSGPPPPPPDRKAGWLFFNLQVARPFTRRPTEVLLTLPPCTGSARTEASENVGKGGRGRGGGG